MQLLLTDLNAVVRECVADLNNNRFMRKLGKSRHELSGRWINRRSRHFPVTGDCRAYQGWSTNVIRPRRGVGCLREQTA